MHTELFLHGRAVLSAEKDVFLLSLTSPAWLDARDMRPHFRHLRCWDKETFGFLNFPNITTPKWFLQEAEGTELRVLSDAG